jgi:general stress protein CsbA
VATRPRQTYVSVVQPQTRNRLGAIALVVALVVLLAAALGYAASAWLALAGPPMPAIGYLAMGAGIFFSLIIGCGLMALLFYSSRHGYDEPYQGPSSGDDRG